MPNQSRQLIVSKGSLDLAQRMQDGWSLSRTSGQSWLSKEGEVPQKVWQKTFARAIEIRLVRGDSAAPTETYELTKQGRGLIDLCSPD